MTGHGIILIIEDDPAIREGVRILLGGEGYSVEEAANGHEGLKKLTDETDLVILDVMMPGISGIKTCEEIRQKSNVPVLFLTAKGRESDKLIGLMAGGDDYLVKPFSYAELLARIKALLRRHLVYDKAPETQEHLKEKWVELQGLRLNTGHNEAYLEGNEVRLTEMEYKLLLLMMKNPQKLFSVQNLYESVWEEPFIYSSGNTVMVHIRRLRKKIEEDPQKPKRIISVWGKGYRFGER
ncbi:MAG: response regulator transcription factor [Eubacteriales bacterium]|nr:response regulator transcription factor [Eubacteriales bacterium]